MSQSSAKGRAGGARGVPPAADGYLRQSQVWSGSFAHALLSGLHWRYAQRLPGWVLSVVRPDFTSCPDLAELQMLGTRPQVALVVCFVSCTSSTPIWLRRPAVVRNALSIPE